MITQVDCNIVSIMLEEIVLPQYIDEINSFECYLTYHGNSKGQVIDISLYIENELDDNIIDSIGVYVRMLGINFFDYYIYARPGRL